MSSTILNHPCHVSAVKTSFEIPPPTFIRTEAWRVRTCSVDSVIKHASIHRFIHRHLFIQYLFCASTFHGTGDAKLNKLSIKLPYCDNRQRKKRNIKYYEGIENRVIE